MNIHQGSNQFDSLIGQKYVKKIISDSGVQSSYGYKGQVHACWTHRMTPNDLRVIRSAGFSIRIIHGRLNYIFTSPNP